MGEKTIFWYRSGVGKSHLSESIMKSMRQAIDISEAKIDIKNTFEIDLIKFSKGGYRNDNLSYEQCFAIMCDYHYENGYPNNWKPSDEWILDRCFEVYEQYFDLKNFTSIISYQMQDYKIKSFPNLMNYFDTKTWRTLIATQLMNALAMLPVVKYDKDMQFEDNDEIYRRINKFLKRNGE